AQDFGYVAGGSSSTPQPSTAQKVKDWWHNGGKEAMAPKIGEARPAPADGTDLIDTDDQILLRVANISDANSITARRAITGLPKCYSSEVQRALLARLAVETLPAERKRILEK